MNESRLLKFLIVVALGLVAYFVYILDIFEGRPPQIQTFMYINPTTEVPLEEESGAWNPNRKILIYAEDESGIKSYKIKATTTDGLVVLEKEEIVVDKPKKLKIWLPKPEVKLPNKTKLHYEISITDWSNANFFSGNTLVKNIDFIINTKSPIISIIANSYKISYGGSALLIFKVDSVDIKEIQVSNGKQQFVPFPFIKDGYWAVLLAWPLTSTNFVGTISVMDTAYNSKKITIPFIKDSSPYYMNSTIHLKEDFLDTKMDSLINDLQRNYPESIHDNFEKFRYVNETIRAEDEETIYKAATSFDSSDISMPKTWSPFMPLKGYTLVGKFGDKRTYIAPNGQKSQSVHLGIDIASVKNDKIIASNDGEIFLNKQLGVYGKSLVLYHGFGLCTLYSHMEKFNVDMNDKVVAGSILGLTGQTGWAFGDHLHFGIMIQGLPVRNAEWMDSRWIKNNITDVFEKAKNYIESNK